MYSTLAAIAIVGCLAWLWADSLRARERAGRVARRACASEGVQFLDDTVALAGLRPVLDFGRPVLRRVYEFEFSRDGDDRQHGIVTVTGARVETVYMEPVAPGPDAGQDPGLAEPQPASTIPDDARIVDLATRRRRH